MRLQASRHLARFPSEWVLIGDRHCSVKWVGLFGATALVGLYTIEDLWNKFGDLKMPKVSRGTRIVFRCKLGRPH